MSVSDKDNDFIFTINKLLGSDFKAFDLTSIKEFDEFLQDTKVKYVKIFYSKKSREFKVINYNTINSNTEDFSKGVLIVKYNEKDLDLSNIFENTYISSFKNNSFNIVYNEISYNVIPKVKSSLSNSGNIIVNYFNNFKSKLKSVEEKMFVNSINDNKLCEENFDLIFTPYEEILFWETASKNDIDSNLKHKAVLIDKYMSNIKNYLMDCELSNEIGSKNLIFSESTSFKIIDKIFTTLIEIMKNNDIKFNTKRMKHFCLLICDYISIKISSELSKIDFSKDHSLVCLNQYINSLKHSNNLIENLNQYLILNKDNIIFANTDLKKTYDRLNDLIDIKTLIHEVAKLTDLDSNKLDKISKQLNSNNVLSTSNSGSSLIESIKKNIYSEIVEKFENQIITKINKKIFKTTNDNQSSNTKEHCISILREMKNYKTILSSKLILQKTQSYREVVLNQLIKYIENLRDYFDATNKTQEISDNFDNINDNFSNNFQEKISNISNKVSLIIFGSSVKQKLETSKKLSIGFLSDISMYKKYLEIYNNFLNDVNAYIDNLFSDWHIQYSDISELLPKTKKNLFEIDSKCNKLKVNFSDVLFNLISDVRILIEYEFYDRIHKDIINVYEEGKKMHKEAITLKQIANFYNNLSSQVIPALQPMLLKCTKDFDDNIKFLVQKSKYLEKGNKLPIGSSSKSAYDIDNFILLVQQAAGTLTVEIRKLKQSHSDILDLITQLLNFDLINNKARWKENLKKARNILNTTCENFDESLTIEWKNHWNFQLYKVLKIQYSISLQKFFSFITQIECNVSIKYKTLTIDPNIEDLKKQVYKEVKNFVSIPAMIQGFTEDCNYYKNLLIENNYLIVDLYNNLNNAILKIEENIKDKFSVYTSLLNVDYENFCIKQLNTFNDWKNNFKILKQVKSEIYKLDETFKFDCFLVNISSFKDYMENAIDLIFDKMSCILKEHALNEVKSIDDFIKHSFNIIKQKPNTLQEIIEFKQSFANIARNKAKNLKKCEELEGINKLLSLMNGNYIELSPLNNRWSNFDTMMNNYSNMLEEQKQEIKSNMNNKMSELNNKLEKFASKFQANRLVPNYIPDKDTDLIEIANNIKNNYDEFSNIEKEVQLIVDDCINFDLEKPDLTVYNNVKDTLSVDKKQWEDFFKFNDEYMKLEKEEWLGIRHKAFGIIQDFVMNYTDKLKKRVNKDFIYMHISKKLSTIKESLNSYKYIIGDNFERDHWKTLFNLLKMDNKITKENLTFGNFLEKTELLVLKQNEIRDLYTRAQGEILIRNSMSELIAWFESAEFIFAEYVHINNSSSKLNKSKAKVTPIIKEWKEIMNDISEKQSLLITIKSSEYFTRFQDQIEQFDTRFANLDVWLSQLNHIQRKWIYLEPIFARGSLPKESSRFKKIDDEYRDIMLNLFNNNKVQTIFNIIGIKDILIMLIEQLDKCQKALNEFLEEKRNNFARLYFLGDEDLLEFLAKSTDKVIIKNNLKKLFQGITNLSTIEDNSKGNSSTYISEINSSLKEIVKLNKKVELVDELEKWLNNLTIEMKETLIINLSTTIKEYMTCNGGGNVDYKYLENCSSQIAGIVEQTVFALAADKAIKSNSLKQLVNTISNRINKLSLLQLSYGSNNQLSKDIKKSSLFKLKNLMLDLIHNREIAELLFSENTDDVNNWEWYKQLKYIYNPNCKNNNSILELRMCDGKFEYTFEYQGASQKLVHTPLTDKCYITLTQAISLGYGGNPYGPAGTGKTESVKALGQAFGRQVLVFNCDEGIDFNAMGRIFVGLTKSGAWGCFDEFNRLLEEQLSAISIQIQLIQNAIKNKSGEILLLNSNVLVNYNSAIFVTLNPASKAYGGRSKLPDNLKMLFRPIAMSTPDNQQIARTLLYSEGFKYSDVLAQKVVSLFLLCKQGLSKQIHYEWGLRSLKTILTVANQQIQLILNNNTNNNKSLDLYDETQILIKAIRINILSKLTYSDNIRFKLLLNDVFPEIKEVSDIEYRDLNSKLIETLKENNLTFIDSQFKKIIQFHESLKQKMGVVLVGPSGCGKTSIWNLLKQAYNKLNISVCTKIINPKSMPRNQLLGYMNLDTGEYFYGVLTKNAKEVEKEPLTTSCWIICDGDVDPEWIEALNSVLDDNRLLTMPNGERVSFTDNINFIFETDSLKYASPATISRLGIIYMNQEDLNIEYVVNSFINVSEERYLSNIKDKEKKEDTNNEIIMENVSKFKLSLENLFKEYFYDTFSDLISSNYQLMVKSTHYGIVTNFLSMLNSYDINHLNNKTLFTDFMIKGLGSFLNEDDKRKFAIEAYNRTSERYSNMIQNPINVYFDQTSFGFKEYVFDDSQTISIKNFNNNKCNPVVVTENIQKNYNIIKNWFCLNKPFLIIGPEGCGKSLLIQYLLQNCSEKYSVSIINCTSQTNSKSIIQKLYQSCIINNTSKGKTLRPKEANKLVLLVKDINLSKPDKYETIQLISLLQQLITYNGFYSEDLEFVNLDKIQIICSMNPSSTLGRYEITSRFTGKVNILYIDYPNKKDLNLIYRKYLESILEYFDTQADDLNLTQNSSNYTKLRNLSASLAEYSIKIYSEIKSKVNNQENIQCIYTPRDVSLWLINLLRYEDIILNINNNNLNYSSILCLIEVWAYECVRVFKDKLNSKEMLQYFDSLLYKEFINLFNMFKQSIQQNISIDSNYLLKQLNQYYSSFDSGLSKVVYNTYLINIQSKEDYIEEIYKGQQIYERDAQDLNLFINNELLYYAKIIDRLISTPNSNLLLIGKTGIGRKKVVRLVGANKRYEFYNLNLFINYSKNDFKKDLKQIYQLTGIEGKNLIMILEEHHIIQSNEFVEYVNSLLYSGEVPGLINKEDIEAMLSSLINEFKEQTEYKSPYDYMVSKVKKHLKIIILLDPTHKEYNNIISNNPSFINKCSVVWFNELHEIDNKFIIENELKDVFPVLNKLISKDSNNIYNKSIVELIISIYNSLCDTSLNPLSKQTLNIATQQKLIEFVLQFKHLISSKLSNSTNHIKHLIQGLAKLEEAENFVNVLNKQAGEQQKEIEVKQKEANESLEQITNSMQLASNKRESLNKLNLELEQENAIVSVNKKKVEEELKDVLPIVEKAKELVSKLSSQNLAEIRVYFKHDILKPEVYAILKATLSILGYTDLSSQGVKSKFGADTISSLVNLDLKKISGSNMSKVEKVINEHPLYFEKENAKRVNFALMQISEYVKSMVHFYHSKKAVIPLEEKLIIAEDKLLKTQRMFDNNKKDLDKIDSLIIEYKKNFETKTQKAEELKYKQKQTLDKIEKASSLLNKLSVEKNRWKEQIEDINSSNILLPYNCLISSAFITFLGLYNESIRLSFVKLWESIIIDNIKSLNNEIYNNCKNLNLKLKNNNNFEELTIFKNITSFLINESETLKLKSEGLPCDQLSLENALIVLNSLSDKTKLIIDPVESATEWFKKSVLKLNKNSLNNKSSNNSDILNISDNKFLTNLELAVRFGKEILIADIDKIEPVLIPLIRREVIKVGARNVIKVGEKLVDLNNSFKLYLSTRDNSIELSSFLISNLCIVNFTATRSGLESLLLGITVEIERPELEQKKNELLEQQSQIKIELADSEKALLNELISLDGNLLENKTLINSLEQTKNKSIKSEDALKESISLSKNIDIQRDMYSKISILATDIYMLLKEIYKLNPMYRYSLIEFINNYKLIINECNTLLKENNDSHNNIDIKLDVFTKNIIKDCYNFYARTVFKTDLITFGLYFIRNIFYKSNEDTNFKLWEFLLGNISIAKGIQNAELPSFITQERSDYYITFANIFKNECQALNIANNQELKNIITKDKLTIVDINLVTKNIQDKAISTDYKLLSIILCYVIRPDQLQSIMRDYICDKINIKSIVPPSLIIQEVCETINHKYPVLFNTSLGSDPSKEIEELAFKVVGKDNYEEIPIGAGNSDKIIITLREAYSKGKWLCLKNVHLSLSFLKLLEKEIKLISSYIEQESNANSNNNIATNIINKNFRLWLTSEPHNKFSHVLLESCYKLSYETPPGVKQNIERIYQIWNSSLFNQPNLISIQDPLTYQSLYCMSVLHALLQERRTYIPQGWTKFYEFSFSDLKVSYETLLEYLNRIKKDNSNNKNYKFNLWKNLKGLIKESFYGGRIDNTFDYEVMETYVDNILNINDIEFQGSKIFLKNSNCNYEFYASIYSSELSKYKDLISKFPESDCPSLFSLPDSVERSVQRFISSEVIIKINTLYSISGLSNSDIKFNKEIWSLKLKPIILLWDSLFNSNILDVIKNLLSKFSTNKLYLENDPIMCYFKSEADSVFILISKINNDINNIESCLFANSVMSSTIYKVCINLLSNVTPQIWQEIWEGYETPQKYLKLVINKFNGIQKYLMYIDENTKNIFNLDIILNNLLYPETFLNSIRQKTTRLLNISINDLLLKSSFNKPNENEASYYVALNGLLLQGCGIDSNGTLSLNSKNENNEEILNLKKLYVYFIDKNKEISNEINVINIPVYENLFREKVIFKINLRYNGNKCDFVLKGIAMSLEA